MTLISLKKFQFRLKKFSGGAFVFCEFSGLQFLYLEFFDIRNNFLHVGVAALPSQATKRIANFYGGFAIKNIRIKSDIKIGITSLKSY